MKLEEAVLEARKKEKSARIERSGQKASVRYFHETETIWSPLEDGIKFFDMIADDWELAE